MLNFKQFYKFNIENLKKYVNIILYGDELVSTSIDHIYTHVEWQLAKYVFVSLRIKINAENNKLAYAA